MPTALALPRQDRTVAAGLSKRVAAIAIVVVAMAMALPSMANPGPFGKASPSLLREAASASGSSLQLIVRATDRGLVEARTLIRRLGGSVTREFPVMGGFSARLPGAALPRLLSSGAVEDVWADGRVHMSSLDLGGLLGVGSSSAPANTVWRQAIRLPSDSSGAGVTVAVLDTGITRLDDFGSRVLARVDFTPDHDGWDKFGHGTHMAGLIAGNGALSGGTWAGAAPKANLVSVKVAGPDGSTDVSVVIAAMQWIVTHRSLYNIRVLNLSFGTDALQPYLLDPLDFAVEQVWRAGIVVVVAAGNRGSLPGTVNKPGDDPFVITVGAADLNETVGTSDDTVAGFSSRGPTHDLIAKPDVVAPGIGMVSDRDAGSTLDTRYPAARIGTYYFKGSGTSQAAAVVSGVAALMIQANPSITPNVLKAALIGTANRNMASLAGAGAGLVDANAAVNAAATNSYASRPANGGLLGPLPSTGLGLIQLSRDSTAVVYSDLNGDGLIDLVTGEITALGGPWMNSSWANAWSGNPWAPYVFEATGWDGKTWAGKTWMGTSWQGKDWSGKTWSC
jgi:serine protease AprX